MKHPWSPYQFAGDARAAGVPEDVIAASIAAGRRIKRQNVDLPVILTLDHLGHLADVHPQQLREVVSRVDDPYRIFHLAKRARPGWNAAAKRAHRTICVPSAPLMQAQRWLAQNVLNAVPPHAAATAFAPGRTLFDAAQRHAGCSWLVKLDVRNFFESISERRAYTVFEGLGYGALLSFEFARLCTREAKERQSRRIASRALPYRATTEGVLPQGAPTSPMIANLAVRDLDGRLESLADSMGWTYSRYADDIAFSTDGKSDRSNAAGIARRAGEEIRRFGLACNEAKTTIAPPGARKILLGLLIDRAAPRLTHEFRNDIETHLYALLHPRIGASAHQARRKFSSKIGMRLHISGLISFAKQIEPSYAYKQYDKFNLINWDR